jgi:hypothetical protein
VWFQSAEAYWRFTAGAATSYHNEMLVESRHAVPFAPTARRVPEAVASSHGNAEDVGTPTDEALRATCCLGAIWILDHDYLLDASLSPV